MQPIMCKNAPRSSAFLQPDQTPAPCKNARMDDEQIAAQQFVRAALEKTGLTASALARHVGTAPSTLTRFLRGEVKHTLSARTLAKIASLLDEPAPMLLTRQERPGADHLSGKESFAIQELDVRAMGGHGAIDDLSQFNGGHKAVAEWTLPADFLRSITPTPDQVVIIRIVGDSMEPHYMAGDRVLVDTSHRIPSPPGVYVIWDGYGLILKHVEVLTGRQPGLARLWSDNSGYAPYEVPVTDLQIQGRVLGKWVWK